MSSGPYDTGVVQRSTPDAIGSSGHEGSYSNEATGDDSNTMKRLLALVLGWTVLSLTSCASPMLPKSGFQPGEEWTMVEQPGGAVTHWQTKPFPGGFGCYKGRDIVELDISKSDSRAYWSPGVSENVRVMLLDGNYIIGSYITDMDSGEILRTGYYFSPPNTSLGDQLAGLAGASYSAKVIKIMDQGKTDRCPSWAEVEAEMQREVGHTWQPWTSTWTTEAGLLKARYVEEQPCAWYVEDWYFSGSHLEKLETEYEGSCAKDGRVLARQEIRNGH